MATADLTAQRLREVLDYNPDTGHFHWKRKSRFNGIKAGQPAGCVNALGYHVIRIDRRLYAAHRLAWLYTHSSWPEQFIDHINGVRTDNRIANLRDVPPASNSQNMKRANKASKSGVLGVSWSKVMKKWHASIVANYQHYRLGYFDDISDAKKAYEDAKRILHDAPLSHQSPS